MQRPALLKGGCNASRWLVFCGEEDYTTSLTNKPPKHGAEESNMDDEKLARILAKLRVRFASIMPMELERGQIESNHHFVPPEHIIRMLESDFDFSVMSMFPVRFIQQNLVIPIIFDEEEDTLSVLMPSHSYHNVNEPIQPEMYRFGKHTTTNFYFTATSVLEAMIDVILPEIE